MENKRIKIKIFFRNMIYIVFILAIGISQVRYATGPVIMPDEVGYWSAGATLAGRDWSGVMSMSPYYGYGYGFILCIIIRLFSAPLNMYRCALILNIFFLVIIFIVSYHIIKLIIPSLDDRIKSLLSFSVSVYSFNIYYAQNTEAEIFQIMIYLIICLCLLKCCEGGKKNKWRMLILSISSTYLLSCHLRNIGVLFVLCVCVFILFIFKQISFKSFITYVLSLVICLVIFWKFKQYINNSLYVVKGYTGEEVAKVQGALGIFSIKGIKSFCINVIGRLFYIGCATFLIGYRGIWNLIEDIFSAIRLHTRINDIVVYKIFILGSLLAEIAIGSLSFLGNETRIDGFLYGRYSEHVMIPILIFGFLSIKKDIVSIKIQTICSIILFLQSIFIYRIYCWFHTIDTATHSIASILGFNICSNVNKNNIQIIFSFGIALYGAAIGWVILCTVFIASKNNINYKFVGILISSVCWIIFSINALHNYFFNFAEYNSSLIEFADEISIPKEEDIYYVLDKASEAENPTSSTWLMYRMRFFIQNRNIEVIDINEIKNEKYIMVYKYSKENEQIEKNRKYLLLLDSEKLKLYVSR